MYDWLTQVILLQIINVNNTAPCFQNYSASIDMFKNCGLGNDFLKGSLIGWQWITGGYFSFAVVSVLSLATYIKYQKVIYPYLIGTMFLPLSYFFFPGIFWTFVMVMSGVTIGILVWYAFISQTNET
jgi:hypothetical protein